MKSAFALPGVRTTALQLCLLLTLISARSYGQSCDCPPVSTCAPCTGGLTNLVLDYSGGVIVTVSASDNGGLLSASALSGTITINSRVAGQPFDGNVTVSVTYLSIPLNLVDSEVITTSCSPAVYEGQQFGNFTVVSGASMGGSLCCSPSDMADIPDPDFNTCPANQTLPLISGCTRTATWTPPTALGDCGEPATITSTHNPGAAFGLGTTTVIYTATDRYGNTATCSFNITITDSILPQITCPSDRNEAANSNCQFIIPNYSSLATATDNCDTNIAITQSPAVGTVLTGLGTTQQITLTATDDSGNTRSCNFIITLTDEIDPQITCPGNMNVAASATNCTYVVQDFTGGATATDNCDGSVTVIQSPIVGTIVTGEGTQQIITLTSIDDAGNTDQCTFTITLIDVTQPQIVCPADKDEIVNGNCEFQIPDYTGLATATDKCDNNVAITQSPAVGTVLSGVGAIQTITLTATDNAGNTRVCNFAITLIDQTAPVITCPANFDVFTVAGTCSFSIPDYTSLASVTDNCDNDVSVIQSPAVGTAMTGHGSTRIITLTAIDLSGNSSSCDFTITLKDNIAPQITTCPSNQQVTLDNSCQVVVPNYTGLAVATDYCDTNVTITQSPLAGTVLTGIGARTVTITATDDAGNLSTCTFQVNVVDNIAPVIAGCPAPITVSSNASSCSAVVNWTAPTASDNCTLASFITNRNPGTTFPLGTTLVIYTATDGSGNTSTCSFNVTVTDVTPPVLTACPSNITTNLSALQCAKTATWTPPTATDNCSVTLTSNYAPGATFPRGTTVVTYTATDGSGNISSCSFNVTVIDNIPPQIVGCSHGSTKEVASSGACSAIATWTPPTATDNCTVTLTSTHNPGDVFPLGKTDVTYTATDAAGNTATCTFKIFVKDQTAPVISGCNTADISVTANASCQGVATWTPPTATDNCSVTLTSSHAPGATFPLGTTLVTYTATDGSGNISTCAFNVIVLDQTPPIISGCISPTIIASADASCQAVVTWTPPMATDNCSVTMTSDHAPGETFQLGTTVVTYTATDGAGNTSTCAFNVVVNDETDPVITGCPASYIVTIADASCQAVVNWPPPAATDNCSVTLTTNYNPGDIFQLGTTTVTYTATDGSGNTATCTFDVVVNDETKPDVIEDIPGEVITVADGSGNATVTWDALICEDNCGSVTIVSTHAPGSVFPVGTTVVTYTATDDSGNTLIKSFNVVVNDVTNPSLTGCVSDIVVTASASCETIVNWSIPVATDNSGSVTLTSSHQSGMAFPLGTTEVMYTATDPSGNTSTCQFKVIVKDESSPVISGCLDDIMAVAGESCQAIVSWIAPTASDNCSVTLVSSHNSGQAFPIGSTTVSYTATDGAGNTSTCSFEVIIKDERSPVISDYPSSAVKANAVESCNQAVTWEEPEVEDCSTLTVTSTHRSGDIFPIGTTEVTYTATDVYGNTSSCKFSVIVEDKTPPVFADCPAAITVMADATCNAIVRWTIPAASDNCQIASVTSTHSPGALFPKGTTEVKYMATDIYGNVSVCQFNVTVKNENPPVISGCVEDIIAKAGGSGQVQIQWTPPTATVQCGEVNLVGSHSPGDYFGLGTTQVEYKATDSDGNFSICTFNVTVSYDEVQFDAVKVITPDGDGINDQWVLGNIEKFNDNKVVIVDRWGSVIFSATGYNNENIIWKGTNSSGTVVPTGTYFYTIAVRIGPALQEKRGFIELIR